MRLIFQCFTANTLITISTLISLSIRSITGYLAARVVIRYLTLNSQGTRVEGIYRECRKIAGKSPSSSSNLSPRCAMFVITTFTFNRFFPTFGM